MPNYQYGHLSREDLDREADPLAVKFCLQGTHMNLTGCDLYQAIGRMIERGDDAGDVAQFFGIGGDRGGKRTVERIKAHFGFRPPEKWSWSTYYVSTFKGKSKEDYYEERRQYRRRKKAQASA